MSESTVVPEQSVVPEQLAPPDRLLTPAEVAVRFHVDPRTVTRWAKQGKISSLRTLGGHRRFLESEVVRLLTM